MFRIIYFPSTGEKPEFRWLADDMERRGTHDSMEELMEGQLAKDFYVQRSQYWKGAPSGFETQYKLQYDDDFMRHYPEQNLALGSACFHMNEFRWGGPVVAYLGHENDGPTKDMDMMDYKILVDFLIKYENDTLDQKFREGHGKLQGVLLPCRGERRVTGVNTCTSKTVSRMHPIWKYGDLSPISKRIGMSLLTLPYCKIRKEWDRDDCWSTIVHMHKGVDPNAEYDGELFRLPSGLSGYRSEKGGFGYAPSKFDKPLGNNLVVRADRKTLDPELVDAFDEYCTHHLPQYWQWANEEADGDDEIQEGVLQDHPG